MRSLLLKIPGIVLQVSVSLSGTQEKRSAYQHLHSWGKKKSKFSKFMKSKWQS